MLGYKSPEASQRIEYIKGMRSKIVSELTTLFDKIKKNPQYQIEIKDIPAMFNTMYMLHYKDPKAFGTFPNQPDMAMTFTDKSKTTIKGIKT